MKRTYKRKKKKLFLIILAVVFCSALLTQPFWQRGLANFFNAQRGEQEPHTKKPAIAQIITQSGRIWVVKLAVARTGREREQGLMYRQHMPEGEGMLFLFPQEEDHIFWMKNTPIPLDMLFIDRDFTVLGIIPNAQPLNEQPLSIGRPSRFVLEVNGGFCERHQINPGDRLHFQNFSVQALP